MSLIPSPPFNPVSQIGTIFDFGSHSSWTIILGGEGLLELGNLLLELGEVPHEILILSSGILVTYRV